MAKPLMFLPLIVMAGFVGASFWAMGRQDPKAMPSALVGRQAAPVQLEVLGSHTPFVDADLRDGTIKLVNFWASWCAPCRVEHPNLTKLSEEGVPVYGVNWKDTPDQALGFLAELGNPFGKLGADPKNKMGIDWGVAGVPETFIIDGEGTVLARIAGPLTDAVIAAQVEPLLAGEGE